MATFVLVHGAMHGGWCWRDVRPLLVAAGHEVRTPTLTGQGERAHLLAPEVGLGTHVRDLCEHLAFEDLHDVHLVLHSYAGILAGPVAAEAGARLASITYLAAFLADPGECLLDVEPPDTAQRYRALAESSGDGWRLPATDAFLAQWGITDPALQAWVGPRLTDFPLRCQTDRVACPDDALASVRQIYVRHTDPPLPSLDASWERARRRGFELHELATGHDIMLAAPTATAELLQAIAGS